MALEIIDFSEAHDDKRSEHFGWHFLADCALIQGNCSESLNLYRRSLYTVWKRTAPMPDMTAFDSPSREVCSVKRTSTVTPQQAFILLNDTQFVEASRVLAERALKEALRLDPRSADGHHIYGFYLAVIGQTTQAVAELKTAKELDPQAAARAGVR
jgi:tetratricopeptide (TPR) repeat protein